VSEDLRYHRVVIGVDLPAQGLQRGDVGVVIDLVPPTDASQGIAGVVVEVQSLLGNTLAVAVLAITDVHPPTAGHVPCVRWRD
jgi:hypothetical protein